APSSRIYQTARCRGLYTRKHHGRRAETLVQGLTAALFTTRAVLGTLLPAYSAADVDTFRESARAALDPYGREAVEDCAPPAPVASGDAAARALPRKVSTSAAE